MHNAANKFALNISSLIKRAILVNKFSNKILLMFAHDTIWKILIKFFNFSFFSFFQKTKSLDFTRAEKF